MERIDFFGSAVFVPIFLVSVGMLLDPSVMVEGETLKLAGLFIAASVGGKAAASWLARLTMGYTRPQAALMLGLTTPQAAATLAATVVGFNIGLFDQAVVNAVLVLILVSIIVGTLIVEHARVKVPAPAAPAQQLGKRILVTVEDPNPGAARLRDRRPRRGSRQRRCARDSGQLAHRRAVAQRAAGPTQRRRIRGRSRHRAPSDGPHRAS
jgi:Kef-type K+ transport system membrane component KefB